MRQNEKAWCQLLNRLREGNPTEDDWSVLQGLKINEILDGSFRICSLRRKVETHNLQVVGNDRDEKSESVAYDRIRDNTLDEKRYVFLLSRLQHPPSPDTGDLHYHLPLLVDKTHMVNLNVSKEDTIVKGMLGYKN